MSVYTIKLLKEKYHELDQMEQWCRDQFGPGEWTHQAGCIGDDLAWSIHSMFGTTWFSFRDPGHLALFVLRWS